jgi:hypothetical protein
MIGVDVLIKNDFEAYGTLGASRAPILLQC